MTQADTTPRVSPAPAGETESVANAPESDGLSALDRAVLDGAIREESPDTFTDQWTANAVAENIRGNVRFLPDQGVFYVWDGSAWTEDDRNQAPYAVSRKLTGLAARARKQAKDAPSETEQKAGHKFARAAQGVTLRDRVLRLVKEHPRIVETAESFDRDPDVLNTPAGLYDLTTGRKSGTGREALCAKCTGVEPRAGGPDMWLRFLAETTLNDPELIAYLQRVVGYAATGHNTEKQLWFFYGPTDSGKSVFARVLSHVFGSYAANVPQGSLLARGSSGHPTDLASYVDARLATSIEVPGPGEAWRGDVVKAITGGDPVSVRKMRQDFREVDPSCRLFLFSNHAPSTKGDPALLRRIIAIPFENRVPLEDQDRDLSDKLIQAEGGKILSWAIEGARLYLTEGLGELPGAVQQATEQYRESEDRLALFIGDACDLAPDHSDTTRHLFDAWRGWCAENGYDRSEIGNQTAFTRMFRQEAEEAHPIEYTSHATDSATGKRGRGFRGIRVKPNDVFEAQTTHLKAVPGGADG